MIPALHDLSARARKPTDREPVSRWPETLAEVRVGIVDDGVDAAHERLRGRVDRGASIDHVDGSAPHVGPGDAHGTAVAGVVVMNAAAAVIQSHRVSFGGEGPADQFVAALRAQAGVDVSNNSWGFVGNFADDRNAGWMEPYMAALRDGAVNGRDGLGTVWVFAAGNSRLDGDNVNYHNMNNAAYVVSVGAVDAQGRAASFSTPGAAVLVSALGVDVQTTDRPGAAGYAAGDTASVSGTSFAAPLVSAVVAEMLAVNPDLGYRDIHEILAYAARSTDAASAGWAENGAANWNGGALTFHHRYGFGIVDAHVAVRLSETWRGQKTAANRVELSDAAALDAPVAIPDGRGAARIHLDVARDIDVERVMVDLDIAHTWRGDLTVRLVSPAGTESVLVDRPGVAPGSGGYGDSASDIVFRTASVAHLGEGSAGRWTLVVEDHASGDSGTVRGAAISFVGAGRDEDDVFVFTDEFASLSGADRGRIEADAGRDVLNAAAVTGAVGVDLAAGSAVIAGRSLTFDAGGSVKEVRGGDGADEIAGAGGGETLDGGRGDDRIAGRGGDDRLAGGFGDDTIDGGRGTDTAVFGGPFAGYTVSAVDGDTLRVEGTARATTAFGADHVRGVEWLEFSDETVAASDLLGASTPEVANLACVRDMTALLAMDALVAAEDALIAA